jgi:hypothetical protein
MPASPAGPLTGTRACRSLVVLMPPCLHARRGGGTRNHRRGPPRPPAARASTGSSSWPASTVGGAVTRAGGRRRLGRASGRPRIAVTVATGATRRSPVVDRRRQPRGARRLEPQSDADASRPPAGRAPDRPSRLPVRQSRSWERGLGGRPRTAGCGWRRAGSRSPPLAPRTTTPDPVTATSPVFWCEIGRLS